MQTEKDVQNFKKRFSAYLCREHLKGKYHCTIDLLFDWFGNVPLCSTKFSAPSMKNISKPVKQEVSDTSPLSVPWLWLQQKERERIKAKAGNTEGEVSLYS